MSFGNPEIHFLGPMMLPDLHFGIENRPERTAECPPREAKCARGNVEALPQDPADGKYGL